MIKKNLWLIALLVNVAYTQAQWRVKVYPEPNKHGEKSRWYHHISGDSLYVLVDTLIDLNGIQNKVRTLQGIPLNSIYKVVYWDNSGSDLLKMAPLAGSIAGAIGGAATTPSLPPPPLSTGSAGGGGIVSFGGTMSMGFPDLRWVPRCFAGCGAGVLIGFLVISIGNNTVRSITINY